MHPSQWTASLSPSSQLSPSIWHSSLLLDYVSCCALFFLSVVSAPSFTSLVYLCADFSFSKLHDFFFSRAQCKDNIFKAYVSTSFIVIIMRNSILTSVVFSVVAPLLSSAVFLCILFQLVLVCFSFSFLLHVSCICLCNLVVSLDAYAF